MGDQRHIVIMCLSVCDSCLSCKNKQFLIQRPNVPSYPSRPHLPRGGLKILPGIPRPEVLLPQHPTESLWFGKYGKSVRGSIRRLLPPHSGASIPSRIPGGWQPHKHDHENALHVQRTSSRHTFPSRRRLCQPGIE